MASDRTAWEPEPATPTDWVLAAALFLAAFAALLWTDNIGVPRDESFYMKAGWDYAQWFRELWTHWQQGELAESFTKSNVDKHWSYNSEHPVLMKTLFGWSNLLFNKYLEWYHPIRSYRIPAMLTGAAGVSVTYLFARRIFGRLAGVVAAGALLLQPRYFAHAHFACFDVPITVFWVATIYAYWRSFESRAWAVGTGILWGLALCTKLNAFFLPVVVFGHWLATNWTSFGLRETDAGWSIEVPPVPRAFVSMAILGPLLFYLLTPRFWFDTSKRVAGYLGFHLGHTHYFVQYFGEGMINPPFPVHYPWVMTLVTVPAMILVAAGLGFVHAALVWDPVDWARRWWQSAADRRRPERHAGDPRGTALLLFINLVFPIALISVPSTPIFGGTKHWMPAMPFLAIFAGGGVALARRLVGRIDWSFASGWADRAVARGSAVLLAAAVLVPAGYATLHVHPFGIGYYNEFIGSIRGAADHGMFRQFWGYSSRQALPWLNQHGTYKGRVWHHNMTGFAWWRYRDENLRRDDFTGAGIPQSEYGLYHHQKAFSMKHRSIWRKYGTFAPAHVLSHEGVPLVSIYRRPELIDAPRTPP